MSNFRYAIMGPGRIAARFARDVNSLEGFEICAVASKSMDKAQKFATEFQVPHAYDSYIEMLEKEKPDCVYIATTPDSHFALAKMCVENNIPVLCEKAMFVTRAEAEELFALAKEKGVFVMEAMWARFLPSHNKAKEWLDSGVIGTPRYAEFHLGFHASEDPNERFLSAELCGGATTDITVYTYELCRFYFDGPVKDMLIAAIPASTGVDLTEVITLNYGEMLATLTTTLGANIHDRVIIYGSKGQIEVPHIFGEREAVLRVDGKEPEKFYEECPDGFVFEIQEAAACIRKGLLEHPTVPHALTIDCADIFDQVYRRIHEVY